MTHPLHSRVRLQVLRDCERIVVVLPHAQRQSLDAPGDQPAVPSAGSFSTFSRYLTECLVGSNRSMQHLLF